MTWFSPWLNTITPRVILWAGAICTLGLYSILYRENKIYRLFEHIFLGLSLGYLVATTWNDTLKPKWWTPMWDKGQWWFIFILVFGLFYYFIYTPRFNWLARAVIGFFLGVAGGRSFQLFTNDVWPQIPASFKPVIPHAAIKDAAGKVLSPELNLPDAINNLLFMVILLCVMSYFFFSFEHRHPVIRTSARWGRWLMMFAFGAIFGSTIMGRLALLIDRMDFLVNDFGPELGGPKAGPVVMLLVLVALCGLVLTLAARSRARGDDEAGGS